MEKDFQELTCSQHALRFPSCKIVFCVKIEESKASLGWRMESQRWFKKTRETVVRRPPCRTALCQILLGRGTVSFRGTQKENGHINVTMEAMAVKQSASLISVIFENTFVSYTNTFSEPL